MLTRYLSARDWSDRRLTSLHPSRLVLTVARLFCLALLLVLAACAAASAQASDPGKLVARKSAAGEMAAFMIEVKVRTPKAIYVRLGGNIGFGELKMLCSRDVNGIRDMDKASNVYRYSRRGLFRVPIKPPRAQRCEMSLSVGGSGQASGEIRVVR